MQPFRYHVFACEQVKAEGVPCCAARGAARTIDALRAEVAKQNLTNTVQITACGSIGLCERGPNLVVYPEGVWYSGVRAEDVPELVREHFVNGKPVVRLLNRDVNAVREEIHTNRNRYLAAMKAQNESGAVPEPVMAIARGYQTSRILLTAIELDIFDAVGEGASAREVAERAGTDPRATGMLLDALVALELLTKSGGRYGNTHITARHFTRAGEHDARAALMHSVGGWQRWSQLTEAVKTGGVPELFDAAETGGAWLRPFIAAMQEGSKVRAASLVRAVGTEGVRRMLDIGGGSGAYSIAFARASHDLNADILDVPAVAPITEEYIAKAEMAERVRVIRGDLRQPAYGGPYDLVLISSICHMLSPAENREMLSKAHEALAPGGRVAISDFLLNEDRTAPRFGAIFALNMLVATREGNSYTESEYASWLRDAGFAEVKRVGVPGPAHLMIGRKRGG